MAGSTTQRVDRTDALDAAQKRMAGNQRRVNVDLRNMILPPEPEFVPNPRRSYLLNGDGEFLPQSDPDPQSIPTEIWEEPETGDH